MIEPSASEEEISKINTKMRSVCSSLSMPIESGNIQLLTSQYYGNYGILVNEKNRERLKGESYESYKVWESGTDESNDAITRALDAIGLGQGDRELNKGVAELLVDLLLDMDDGNMKFNIADLGTGTGSTLDAILQLMLRNEATVSIASRCTFYGVELSWDRLAAARVKIGRNKINDAINKLRFIPKCEPLEDYLDEQRPGYLHAIVSSGALHHCSFGDHFDKMYEALSDEGVMVIGDWHNNLFSHPANLISVLVNLQATPEAIRDFKRLFNVSEDDAKQFDKELTREERIANKYFADFIVKMAIELKKIEERSRLPFFEALESVGDRVEKIERAGFIMDIEELREKHRGFIRVLDPEKGRVVRPVFPKTTVACVMGAAKIAR